MKTQLEGIVNISKVEITKVLMPEFIEWDGCILLVASNDIGSLGTYFKPNQYFCDRTGYEAYNNHIHVNDYFPEAEESQDLSLKIALQILDIWEQKLKEHFSNFKFHLILSHDEFDSVVRFYKYRPEEGSWINVDNIEGYTEGGILLREI